IRAPAKRGDQAPDDAGHFLPNTRFSFLARWTIRGVYLSGVRNGRGVRSLVSVLRDEAPNIERGRNCSPVEERRQGTFFPGANRYPDGRRDPDWTEHRSDRSQAI